MLIVHDEVVEKLKTCDEQFLVCGLSVHRTLDGILLEEACENSHDATMEDQLLSGR